MELSLETRVVNDNISKITNGLVEGKDPSWYHSDLDNELLKEKLKDSFKDPEETESTNYKETNYSFIKKVYTKLINFLPFYQNKQINPFPLF